MVASRRSKATTKRKLAAELAAVLPRFQEAVDLITVHVRYLLRRHGLMRPEEAVHRVTGRVKDVGSAVRKVRAIERLKKVRIQSASQILAHVDDLAGVRIVCPYLRDVMLVYGYIRGHRAFREVRGKFEDYIARPKSGYRALHTVVRIDTTFGPAKCEIQIRTGLQDSWAVRSHGLVYKLRKTDVERLPREIRNLLVSQSDMLYTIDRGAGEIAGLIKKYLKGSTR